METSIDIQNICTSRHWTVATAESCTGGRIASRLTAIAGSSAYFEGSIVAYQERVKERLLNVDAQMIEQYNVVSEPVAKSMVKGACRLFGSDFAVASTGCAGPGGGTDKIPVGTIWIAAGNKDVQITRCLHHDKGRIQNVEEAADQALLLLLQFIQEQIKTTE